MNSKLTEKFSVNFQSFVLIFHSVSKKTEMFSVDFEIVLNLFSLF